MSTPTSNQGSKLTLGITCPYFIVYYYENKYMYMYSMGPPCNWGVGVGHLMCIVYTPCTCTCRCKGMCVLDLHVQYSL